MIKSNRKQYGIKKFVYFGFIWAEQLMLILQWCVYKR